jgi:cytoskeletal protein CcmA (bactofilin family)
MFKLKPTKKQRFDTLIGASTRIHGDVEFSGGLHVEGTINGSVTGDRSSSAILSVSEGGCIEGSVIVKDMMLNGIVKGDIDASHRVEMGEKARVMGNVHYTVIETAVGAQINGKLIHRIAGTEAGDVQALPGTASAESGEMPAEGSPVTGPGALTGT